VASLDDGSLDHRGTAMNHLTGALALDPENPEALSLLRRLVTHVPATLPAEVERVREQSAATTRAGVARTVALRMGMWLALVPLVWAMVPVSAPLGTAVVAALLVAAGIAFSAGRRPQLSSAGMTLVMVATGLVLLALVLLFGSFMVVPTMVSTALVMFAGELRPRARVLTIAAGLAIVLVPFLLEQLGVVPPGYEFSVDQVRLLPRLVHFPPGLTKLVLVIATMSTLAMPGVLAGQLRDKLAHAEKRLFMMAWHLEALGRRAT
jgi:serine/threonine-protein kinase